jgi:hypothetical protein
MASMEDQQDKKKKKPQPEQQNNSHSAQLHTPFMLTSLRVVDGFLLAEAAVEDCVLFFSGAPLLLALALCAVERTVLRAPLSCVGCRLAVLLGTPPTSRLGFTRRDPGFRRAYAAMALVRRSTAQYSDPS